MKKRRALVTGVQGQDGGLVAGILLEKGYDVLGLVHKDGVALKHGITAIHGDMADVDSVRRAAKEAQADEVYNFAGISDFATARKEPELTHAVNFLAVAALLDEALQVNPAARFLQASSSWVFKAAQQLLNEDAERDRETREPYSYAKVLADDAVQKAREAGAFACSAILFNHDSPLRTKGVLWKIATTLKAATENEHEVLYLGNIDEARDWGSAVEYADAMVRVLALDKAEDFVLASGKLHSVREAIEIASRTLGKEIIWRGEGAGLQGFWGERAVVRMDEERWSPIRVQPRIGDSTKAGRILHWQARTDFETMVTSIVCGIGS